MPCLKANTPHCYTTILPVITTTVTYCDIMFFFHRTVSDCMQASVSALYLYYLFLHGEGGIYQSINSHFLRVTNTKMLT